MKRTVLAIILSLLLILTCLPLGNKEKVNIDNEFSYAESTTEEPETEKESEKEPEIVVSSEEESIEEYLEDEYSSEEIQANILISPDWSKYTAPEKMAKKEGHYKRLWDEYMYGYEAGSSNGAIFPFVASVYSYENDYSDEYFYKCGFVDETGTIVSDGVYDYVYNGDRFESWADVMNLKCNYERDAGDYWEAAWGGEKYFIAKDGSKVLKCDDFKNTNGCLQLYESSLGNRSCSNNVYTREFSFKIGDEYGNTVFDKTYNISFEIENEEYLEYREDLNSYTPLNDHLVPSDDLKYLIYKVITRDEFYYPTYKAKMLDRETGQILFSGEEIMQCDNGSYICCAGECYLLDANLSEIPNSRFDRIRYLKDNAYMVSENEKDSLYILSGGQLVKTPAEIKAEWDLVGDTIVTDDGYDFSKQVFFDLNGNQKTDPIENQFTMLKKHASSVLKDRITGIEYAFDDEDGRLTVTSSVNNKVVYTTTDISGGYRIAESVVNGKCMIQNKLIDFNTGKCIFEYASVYTDEGM